MLSMIKACRIGMKEVPAHIDRGRGFLYDMGGVPGGLKCGHPDLPATRTRISHS